MKGLEKILKERQKQEAKGYDEEHDKQHDSKELLYAAIALLITQMDRPPAPPSDLNRWFRSLPEWIQEIGSKNESDYEDALRVSGALIAAELNRVSE